MIDFYTEIKKAVSERLTKLIEARDSLQSQRAALSERIKDVEAHIARLEQDGAALDLQAGEALGKGSVSYGKYQAKLKNNVTELECSRRELASLNSSLEGNMKELTLAQRHLADGVKILAREKLPLAQNEIKSRVEEIIQIFDQWIDDWNRCLGEFGESLSTRGDLLPGIVHERIHPKLPGLISMLKIEEQIERLRRAKENK
jgi:chromosome segregation ATPase